MNDVDVKKELKTIASGILLGVACFLALKVYSKTSNNFFTMMVFVAIVSVSSVIYPFYDDARCIFLRGIFLVLQWIFASVFLFNAIYVMVNRNNTNTFNLLILAFGCTIFSGFWHMHKILEYKSK